MKKRANALAVFVVAATALASGTAFAADSLWAGTWQLDLARSKFSGTSAPRAGIEKFEVIENGLKITSDTTNAQGRRIHTDVVVKFDGKDYPQRSLVDGRPQADGTSIAITEIDLRTLEVTLKRDGQVLGTIVDALSVDGKTRTSAVSGMGSQGQVVSNTLVYQKQ